MIPECRWDLLSFNSYTFVLLIIIIVSNQIILQLHLLTIIKHFNLHVYENNQHL